MLSYRHAYHAGNHADVLKHLSLIALLRHFNAKEAPYCYLDSHSGKGYYDLSDAHAAKNAEYAGGVAKLWGSKWDDPVLSTYCELLRGVNPREHNPIRHYLGSPAIARELCRKQDKLILMELHSKEFELLKQNFRRDSRVHTHQRDGFEGLSATAPPTPRRGLALIDPAYEVKSDYDSIVVCAEKLYRKWQTGVVAVWFPLLAVAADRSEWLKKRFRHIGADRVLLVELRVAEQSSQTGMHGSGMIIINPPWQLDKTLQQSLSLACQGLQPAHPDPLSIQWLANS